MRWYYWIATVFYCAGIFLLSSSSEPVPSEYDFPGLDKIAHLVVYGGLAGLVSVGTYRSGRPVSAFRQWLFPVLFSVGYGLTDEIHQLGVPERSFDPLDLVADTLGALAVQLVLAWWWGKLRRRPASE